jgi:hypothetical protein
MGPKSKPGKSKKKGGMGYLMAMLVALAIMLPASANRSEAMDLPSLSFSEPYADHGLYGSLNLTKGNVENRGGGISTVYGPFVTLRSGENRVLSGMVSLGGAIGPSATATDQAVGASVGIGPCLMNDMICLHGGYKVDVTTGNRVRQLLFLGRVMQF